MLTGVLVDRTIGRAFDGSADCGGEPRWLAASSCPSPGLWGVKDPGREASFPISASGPAPGPGQTSVRVLQMNLCSSGIADCYTGGRAVGMAAALIHDYRPEVVTLNEVCRDDVSVLKGAMSATFRSARVASAFRSAVDRRTNGGFRCLNGQQFGDGVLALVPSAAHGDRTYGGVYPVQDLTDPEERVWVCIDMAPEFAACTTHTASTSRTIALAQCRDFLRSVVPMMRSLDGGDPVILGADLNLSAGGSPGAQSCLPRGYERTDDGGVQNVVGSPGIVVRSRLDIDMRGTTDHPGLLVEVVRPHGSDRRPPDSDHAAPHQSRRTRLDRRTIEPGQNLPGVVSAQEHD